MIDLYALTSPNVQKIFLMLEECGLPYVTKPVDLEQFMQVVRGIEDFWLSIVKLPNA